MELELSVPFEKMARGRGTRVRAELEFSVEFELSVKLELNAPLEKNR